MNIFTLYFLRYTYSLSSLLATTFNHLSWCLFIEFLCGKDRNGGSDNRWTEVAVTDKKRKKHKRYVCLSALVVSQQSYAAAPQKLKKPKHEISESISRQLDKMKKKKKKPHRWKTLSGYNFRRQRAMPQSSWHILVILLLVLPFSPKSSTWCGTSNLESLIWPGPIEINPF